MRNNTNQFYSCLKLHEEQRLRWESLVKSIIFRLFPEPFFKISSQDFIQSKNDSVSLESLVQ